jgi:hypothetical protein
MLPFFAFLNKCFHSTASYLTTFCRYYPFYVAPFVSDLKGLSRVEISFILDKPLRPFDQLMAVLPMRRHIHCPYFCHACYLLGFYDVIVDNFKHPPPLLQLVCSPKMLQGNNGPQRIWLPEVGAWHEWETFLVESELLFHMCNNGSMNWIN